MLRHVLRGVVVAGVVLAGCARGSVTTPGPMQVFVAAPEPVPGASVQLGAVGLHPHHEVQVEFGRPGVGFVGIATARASARGELTTEVTVPAWAEPEATYVFVLEDPDGIRIVSRPLTVRRAALPPLVAGAR